MSPELRPEDYVPREEFNNYRTETCKNFDRVFSGLKKNENNLSTINKEVGAIKVQTAVIETRVDSILSNIETMGKNMDTHFDLVKEASTAREEANTLRMERLIENTLRSEFTKSGVAAPPEEDSDTDEHDDDEDGKEKSSSVLPLVISGVTGVLVALIQILPKLLG